MDIPEYRTIAGQSYPIGSLGKNDLRLRVQNTTIEECREYAMKLEQWGFIKVTGKEILHLKK